MEQLSYRLPKTKYGEKTFEKIIESGKRLFAQNGYHATSINDIIDHADIAAGTFYIYFDNKLMLYLYLLQEYKIGIRKASSEATKGLKTRYEIERAGLKAFITYVNNDPLAYKVIWESLFVDYQIFKDYYQSFSKSYIFHLKQFVKVEELRDDLDLETLSFVLMGIANFVGLQILFKENVTEEDIDFAVDHVMKMLEHGIFINQIIVDEDIND